MRTEITIAVPDVADLGPAMRACTEKERAFVVAYFETGKREQAAHLAGYAGAPKSDLIGVQAYNVWHRPRVQEAIREFADNSVLRGLVPMAFVVISDALKGVATKEQIKAAQIVMDRTGFHAKQEMTVNHVDASRTDQIKSIIKLAREQGLDPRKLIGGAVDFVDADFEVLAGEGEPGGTTEGLEDLL